MREKPGNARGRSQISIKWQHFQSETILLNVRWYCRYSLSYRDLEEMMSEQGLVVDHTTIYRWVQDYAPEIDKRIRPHLQQTNDSWRVDETFIEIKRVWKYLYRAVDSEGNTLDLRHECETRWQSSGTLFPSSLGSEAHSGSTGDHGG